MILIKNGWSKDSKIFINKMSIKKHFLDHQSTLKSFTVNNANFDKIRKASDLMVKAINSGNKIFSCGNGGSMCDAMHFAQELSGYYNQKRIALPAICISDPSHITCVANDSSFDFIFSRFLEANGNENDVLFAISTSGNSINVVNAAKEAKNKGMLVISLSSNDGGMLAKYSDICICIDTIKTDLAQELHIIIIHSIISYVEEKLNL